MPERRMLGHMSDSTAAPAPETHRHELRNARTARLWREWRVRGDAQARDRLIELLIPLVTSICQRRLRAGLPPYMEVDDMTSAAYLALIGAVDRYSPRRGATIESYVWSRCEGAVLDWMRGEFPGSRGLREYERGREALGAKLGREPSEHEVAGALELTVEQVRRRELERSTRWTVSLSESVSEESEHTERADTAEMLVASDRREDPEAAMELRDTTRVVRAAIRGLPHNERAAVVGANLHDTPLRRIGEAIGVSESRVSQLRARAIERLLEALGEHRELVPAA
jgi:RNA polymerase sigma factor for flagellar operon FliA